MADQKDCLFFKLPPELRNMVYHHAFDCGPGFYVDFHAAYHEAPKLDLALTCRQACDEAMPVYQACYKKYLGSKTFEFYRTLSYDERLITAKHIQHMKKILVTFVALARNWPEGRYSVMFELNAMEPQQGDGWTGWIGISLTGSLVRNLMHVTEQSATDRDHDHAEGSDGVSDRKKRFLDDILELCRSIQISTPRKVAGLLTY